MWKKTTNKTGMTKTATIRKTTETRKTTGITRKTEITGASLNILTCRITVARNKEWPGINTFLFQAILYF